MYNGYNLPNNNLNTQVFYCNNGDFQIWKKPPGAQLIHIICIGAGAGGGGGATRASGQTSGDGGGGACGVSPAGGDVGGVAGVVCCEAEVLGEVGGVDGGLVVGVGVAFGLGERDVVS